MSVAQFDLFAGPRPANRDRKPLRPYQLEAVRLIGERLANDSSTLLVLPTGAGKTRTAAEVVKHWDGPVLWIAHRNELIEQARVALADVTGEMVSTEKADLRADGTRIVVASVQTLKGERLRTFAQRHPWTLMVCDEGHHFLADSYRAVHAARPAKLLGLTATPDRSDERAMGQAFDSVAFVYEIQEAIADGYLCPIRVKQVMVGAIDLSGVGTVAGDLNQGELDAVMAAEEVLHGICKPLVELSGDRRTIGFFTSVEAAHRAAEIINRYKPNSARAVDGTTAVDTRRQLLKDFDAERFQYLCNVGIATEGYDSPGVKCIAIARPTKSRALYSQMVGRGLRPHAAAPDALVLDFVGNSGKHHLVSALDILAGKYDDDVIEAARDILEAQGMDGMLAQDALDKAQKAADLRAALEAARRAKLVAKNVQRVVIDRDPFGMLGVQRPDTDPKYARYRAEATPPQVAYLKKKYIPNPEKLSKQEASALISKLIKRGDNGFASFWQINQLKNHGIDGAAFTFQQAFRVLESRTRLGRALAPQDLRLALDRQPGEEG